VDFYGAATLTIATNDLGNSGSGGPLSDADMVTITVLPVNDAPRVVVPAHQNALEDTPFIFSAAGGNAISIVDSDSGGSPIKVSLTATVGQLTLSSTAGLTFLSGDGDSDAAMTFTGTRAAVNTALDGLRYTVPANYTGTAEILVTVDDQGNTGAGGPLSDRATAFISVSPDGLNEAPVTSIPGPQRTAQDTSIVLSNANSNAIWITDDAGDGLVTATLTVTHGTVTLSHTTGPETVSNSYTAGVQDSPQVAATPTGEHVVVWRSNGQDGSGEGIYGQRFNAAGLTLGPEFRVNTTTANNQSTPVVAINSSGAFVVVWVSDGQDGDGKGIFAQRFDAGGAPLGVEFLVNTIISGDQTSPTVALSDNGQFVVCWQSADGNGKGVFAQRYDANGEAQGDEFQVNTTFSGDQILPVAAIDANGNFVIAWQGSDGNGDGIFAQRFDAVGTVLGAEFRVNTTVANNQSAPDLAMDSAGNFVIAWQGRDAQDAGIFAQRYDLTGTPVGGEFQVNTTAAGSQTQPSVSTNDSGEFVVAWQSADGNGQGVFAQAYAADGTRLGSEFRANATTNGDQVAPSVAMGANGRSIVVWTGDALDGSQTCIVTQHLSKGDELLYTAGDGVSDAFVTVTGKLADLNAALDGLVFTPDPGFIGVATIRIDVSDLGHTGAGGAKTDSDTVDILVGSMPLVDLDGDDSSGAVGSGYQTSFRQGIGGVRIVDSDFLLTDPNSGNLRWLEVTITNLKDGAAESLAADVTGTAIVASYDSATGTLSLTGTDTIARYRQVLGSVKYDNMAALPNPAVRLITVVAWDGTSTSNTATTMLSFINLPPAVSLTGTTLTYLEDDPATVIDPDATMTDPDSTDFDTGVLTVDFAAGGTSDDRLAIFNQGSGAGQVGVAGGNVTYSGVTIGAVSGGSDGFTPLVVTFNANANPSAVQAVLRNVTFANVSNAPATAPRTVRFLLTDGDGGTSNAATRPINVTAQNDAPVLNGVTGDDQVYAKGGGPRIIEQGGDALVSDVDSPDFAAGYLSVSIVAGGTPTEDVLSIRNQGTAPGQIGFDGLNVTYGGLTIGIASGGSGGADLVITLNAVATPAAVTALVQQISYANANALNPVMGARTVRFTLVDGDGGTSLAEDATVTVVNNMLIVDTTRDIVDGNTSSVANLLANKGADGQISLREAITAANNTAGLDGIRFNIPNSDANHYYYQDDGVAGSLSRITATSLDDAAVTDFDPDYPYGGYSWFTIDLNPSSAQLEISDPVVLDGYTQPGASTNTLAIGDDARLKIELTSTGADGHRGLTVQPGGAGSTIRGLAIQGFDGSGIMLEPGADGTTVEGNFLGTDVTGTIELGNGDDGIQVRSSNNVIGGASPASRNLMSGNANRGLAFFTFSGTADNNRVENNYIGVDATGTQAIGNAAQGISAYNVSNSLIRDNVISGNAAEGIWFRTLTSTGNTVQGNLIGTDATGSAPLGNGADGILLDNGAGWNTLGGLAAGQGNTIAYNGGDGINVLSASQVLIQRNSIYANGGLGIDLGGNGVTANDNRDLDVGANWLQNYPALISALVNGATTTVSGTLNSLPNSTFTIELFASPGKDATGYGEGKAYLDSLTVTTDGNGDATFSKVVSNITVGEWISATATDAFGNTSEFAFDIEATLPLNSAPVLSGANSLSAIDEDAAGDLGTRISELIAGMVTDGDAGALSGIAVIAVDNTNGTLQFSTDGGDTWTAFGTPSAGNARLLAADDNTQVRFVPDADWNGTVANGLTFQAWDRTSGIAGATADATLNGGTTAYSVATASAGITVNAVNDAPLGADQTVATPEDTPYVFSAGDFGFADPQDVPPDGLLAVKITAIPNAGSLTDNGVVVTAGQTIPLADINASQLVFTPGANANGIGYASFTFHVQVSGGTDRGGVDTDLSSKTITVDVTAVNDAPAGLPTITGTPMEDQSLTADVSGITDAEGLGAFSYQWLRNGMAITGAVSTTYTLGDADVGAQISVQVSYTDGQGSAESVTSAQVGPVTNVNDAPVGLPIITGTATEDQTLTVDTSGISDADGLGAFSYQWLRN
jgi:hypothetical protein